MSRRARRIVIPLIVTLLAAGVVWSMIRASQRQQPSEVADNNATPAQVVDDETIAPPVDDGQVEDDDDAAEPIAEQTTETPTLSAAEDAVDLAGLTAVAPGGSSDVPPTPLGSLDPREASMQVVFSDDRTGIARMTLSDQWETALEARQAEEHYDALAKGVAPGAAPPLPPLEKRYVLKTEQTIRWGNPPQETTVSVLSAYGVEINTTLVTLVGENVWSETAPGVFESIVRNENGDDVLHIKRSFDLIDDTYEIRLEQVATNRSGQPLNIRWIQYGPGDLEADRSRYMDRRRFRFGWLPDPVKYPARNLVVSSDSDFFFERGDVLKLGKKGEATLWPDEEVVEQNHELSWFASTNRYFTLAVHPLLDENGVGNKSLAPNVESIRHQEWSHPEFPDDDDKKIILTVLFSPLRTLEPAAATEFDLGVYAGPMNPKILENEQPFAALNMQALIIYQMSSFCAICTFQWLAHLLLWFLTFLHNYVVFDWGLAIIGLVIVVRTLLHPITKKSQVNMQRFGKRMSAIKPEIDKLQKKFGNDPKRMQQEQLRVMREHGMNPMQALGCLPMFLQTPIWIALYAMLYFAWPIRQEPAFFGLFQQIGDWPFLADLSAADHFFGTLDEPVRFLLWNVTGFNMLPLLMGAVFFFQQKYMSPPPSPTMTDEQIAQQKIMRVLMVVMFPLMLYSAPSGLTLYILTSSTIGMFESKYIRAHVAEMDDEPIQPKRKKKVKSKVNKRDPQARAYADALKRAKQKKQKKQSFKKRK